jgi:hypothetical protein
MHVNLSDPMIQDIITKTFPDYKGRKITVEVCDYPINCASYWDSGCRDYFRFLCIETMKASDEMPAQSAFDTPVKGIDAIKLEPGIVCVKRTFSGMHEYVSILVHPNNAAKLLPDNNVDLTIDEQIVLVATRSLKSSYAGISNYRFHEARSTGITLERWDAAIASLIAKKFLDKRKAITNEGRNAIETKGKYLSLRELKA